MKIRIDEMKNINYKFDEKKTEPQNVVDFESVLNSVKNDTDESQKKVIGERFFTGNNDTDKRIQHLLDNIQNIIDTDVNAKKYYKPNGKFDINQLLEDNEGCFNTRNIKGVMDDVMGLWKCGIIDDDDMLEAIKWLKLKEYSLHLKLENEVRSSEIINKHRDSSELLH